MRSTIIVIALGGAITLLVLDLMRSCDSLIWKLSLFAVELVDPEAADSLWWATSRRSISTPVHVLAGSAVPAPDIPDRIYERADEWRDVQSGVVTLLPPLNLVLLTKPYWGSSLDSFAHVVLAQNPSLRSAQAPYVREPHLLYQIGGGVEGLETQILVAESGRAWLWATERLEDDAPFPPAVVTAIPRSSAVRMIALARVAGLDRAEEVHYHCDVLDGRTITLAIIDRAHVGRESFANNARLEGPFGELLELLVTAFDLHPDYGTIVGESPNPSLQRTPPGCD